MTRRLWHCCPVIEVVPGDLAIEDHRQAADSATDASGDRANDRLDDGSGDATHRIKALDGLRGIAVAAVVIYHLSPSLLPGGFLGVSVFFVLSGYLITTLLLGESRSTGSIGLRRFWGRRFRRLMPAALAALAVAVVVAALVGDAHQLRTLPGDVSAAVFYVANWRFIAVGTAYGAHYQQPSVVQHFWSLAIEEQFYVVVALVAALLAHFAPSRRTWFLVFGALALGSMATTIILGPTDTNRIYFGTATRAFELLAGSLLAIALGGRSFTPRSARGRLALQAVGLGAMIVLIGAFARIHIENKWLYRGGLWVAAAVTVAILVAVRSRGPLARAMAWRPLVALGLISYGVYLYHWPLFIWLTPTTTHLDGLALAAVRLGATFTLAIASYRLLEQPIRRRHWNLPVAATAGVVAVIVVGVIGGSLLVGDQATARAVVRAPDLALANPTTVPGATTPTSQPDDATALPPPATILMVGDSVLHDAFPAMQAGFRAVGTRATAIGGPAQTLSGNGARWLDEITAAVDAGNPDVVVLESCCGSTDPYVAPDGTRIEIDTPAFWDLWTSLVSQATDRAGARGARVMWVLPPPADGVRSLWYGDIKERMLKVADIERALSLARPDVHLVDWGVLAAPDRSYSATLPDKDGKPVVIRDADGVHFSPVGQALQARTTVEQVLDAWRRSGGRPDPNAISPGT
jgi:peptidoglycan/LPS O-acetylase OafA/YrhL